jgi:hypothetical protein
LATVSGPRDPKGIALTLLGGLAALCFIGGAVLVWDHEYRHAFWQIAVGVLLVIVFFRFRMTAFLAIALGVPFVLTGMSLPFHPSKTGFGVFLLSGVFLVLLAYWINKRYPDYKQGDLIKGGLFKP